MRKEQKEIEHIRREHTQEGKGETWKKGWWKILLVEAGGANNNVRDLVGVGIGSWAAIFQITLSFFGHWTRNANTAAAIGNT